LDNTNKKNNLILLKVNLKEKNKKEPTNKSILIDQVQKKYPHNPTGDLNTLKFTRGTKTKIVN
jgi:hypothetical protein